MARKSNNSELREVWKEAAAAGGDGIRPMLDFKRFQTAAITISGIELAAKIRKHQFKIGKLFGQPTTIPSNLDGCDRRLNTTLRSSQNGLRHSLKSLHQNPLCQIHSA